MKRIYTFMLLAVISLMAWAQTNPNRLIVTDKIGGYQGFLVERIDSMFFTQIEGRVAADIEIKDLKCGATGDTLYLAITRTEECWSYQIEVIPTNTMSYLTDEAALASYVERQGGQRYYQDFTNAMMTGLDLKPKADYTIVTLGYDKYGIACSTSKAEFSTPAPAIVGNPVVVATVDNVTATSFTITFVPNDDVAAYSMCSFPKGELEMQFQMWGPMFGFSTIGEMIYQWGIEQNGDYTHTWSGMSPSTEYDVWIQPLDINGNMAEPTCCTVTTLTPGGDGVAEITITIGDIMTYNGNMYQAVTFTPNDDCGVYHAMLMTKALYDAEYGDEGILPVIQSSTNPFNPWDSYWDLVGTDASYWNVDPETEFIAIAMGKNGNDEWGPLATLTFTTPALPDAEDASQAPVRVSSRHKVGKSVGTTRPSLNFDSILPAKGIMLK